MNRAFTEIDIDNVIIKSQLREHNGDLLTLENSIRKLGLLCPVIIDSNNVLISGRRRLAACRNAGIKKIPALKLDIDANSMIALDIQSDENLCRQPLSSRELEKHIQLKKIIMTEKEPTRSRGFFSKFMKLFFKNGEK